MHRWRVLLAIATLVLGACSGDGTGDAGADPSPSPSFPFATVLLDNGEESTLVTVEVAETPEQKERGLTEKDSLPEDEGMAFIFFEPRDAGLATTGTTIPLSVAFFDERGTIVSVLDVDPCEAGPCSSRAPGVQYMGALAVNQGAFDRWGISEGDHLQLTR
jgi:hypothetical protein